MMDQAKMASKIKEHMEVVGSNDQYFAIVDNVEGVAIKLTKDEQGHHHFIPMSWVIRVDEHVHIDRPGDQAMAEWSTETPQG